MEKTLEIMKHNEKLVQYLLEHSPDYLREWKDKSLFYGSNEFEMKIMNTVVQLNTFFINTLSEKINDYSLHELAYKTAKERVEANVNIGDFLYNINLGRKIIITYLFNADFSTQYLKYSLDKVNDIFDDFSNYCVSMYTNIKNDLIEEKNLYIIENHKDRMALLGQISSSFVHEFRNPLTSIIGFNKLLQKEYPDLKYVDIMDYELKQLNFRITQFLHTSKLKFNENIRQNVNLLELINEVIQLSQASLITENIKIRKDICSQGIITVNREELRQVFLNILINSIEALSDKTDDCIIEIISRVDNGQLVIYFSNNGPVIEPGKLNQIFDPFFTTKDLGTGIGLYVCKKIVEENAGEIHCESEIGRTSFIISLPICVEL